MTQKIQARMQDMIQVIEQAGTNPMAHDKETVETGFSFFRSEIQNSATKGVEKNTPPERDCNPNRSVTGTRKAKKK